MTAEDECWTLQGNYGGAAGWEDLTSDETEAGIRESLVDYQLNEGGRYRIVRPASHSEKLAP